MFDVKARVRELLGEELLGSLDYFRFPERISSWGGPFNGQRARLALFREIVRTLQPGAIIETGTYLGTTTELFAGTGCAVFTIEGEPRRYGFARARLRRHRNVTVCLGDSRAELQALFGGPLKWRGDKALFAYLDAHWNADLPLAEEVDIVFSNCPKAIVMIDDFQVPFDDGYGYDDYGEGRALTPGYLETVCAKHDLEMFFPSTPASEESGLRRGCVVLGGRKTLVPGLRAISLLRSANA